MNQTNSIDAPSAMTAFGRLLCLLLPVPLLAVGWPIVTFAALDFMMTGTFSHGYGDDFSVILGMYCMFFVGACMGIQMSADFFRRWQITVRRRHVSWQFTILSGCCVAFILFLVCVGLENSSQMNPREKLWLVGYFCLVQFPAIVWFLINVWRFIKSSKAVA